MIKDGEYTDGLFALAAMIGEAMQKADALGLPTIGVHLSSAVNECQRKIADLARDHTF